MVDSTFGETVESKSLLIHLLALEANEVFDGYSLESLKLDSNYNSILHRLIYRLHTMIPAENMKEETHTFSVTYPDGWWNAFKERYFPVWLLKRCKIGYVTKGETVKFTAYMLYPKLPQVLRGDTEFQYITTEVNHNL